jgi:hypothetical protein
MDERIIAIVPLVTLLVSCGPLPVSLSEDPQSFSSKDYERVYERWTRHAEVYNLDTFDNSLTVSATYRSWQFRQAYVERYADDYRLDGAAKKAFLEEQRRDHDAWHEFLVSATASKIRWADFTRDDTPWVIALVADEGPEVAPASLEKISSPSPMLKTYYPSISIYRKTFLIRFPRMREEASVPVFPSGLDSFSLVFAGALGRAELVWKIRD